MAKDVDADDFTHPDLPRGLGGGGRLRRHRPTLPTGEVWVSKLRDSVTEPALIQALSALAVEPVQARLPRRRTPRSTSTGCRRSPRFAASRA